MRPPSRALHGNPGFLQSLAGAKDGASVLGPWPGKLLHSLPDGVMRATESERESGIPRLYPSRQRQRCSEPELRRVDPAAHPLGPYVL